jgi:hypothetical protein
MKEKPDALEGMLALMVLKTLDVLGSQHGWGIARRYEQISGDHLAVNRGTLYPLLLELEHECPVASELGRWKTTAWHASIYLPIPVADNRKKRTANGNKPRRSSCAFSSSTRRN